MSKHRLWYSTRCRFCQGFLEELATTPFVSQFQLICIDPSPSRQPLPNWLKSVPTLWVAGEGEPRVGPGPVNNWLAEARINGGNSGMKNSQQAMDDRRVPLTAPVYSPDMAPRGEATGRANPRTMGSPAVNGVGGGGATVTSMGAPNGEPAAYYGSELEGGMWSDNFSFIGSEFSSEKGVNPIERNFASLIPGGAANAGSAAAAAAIAPQAKRTAKEDALLKEFEAYTASRDRDISKPTQRM